MHARVRAEGKREKPSYKSRNSNRYSHSHFNASENRKYAILFVDEMTGSALCVHALRDAFVSRHVHVYNRTRKIA